MINKVRSTQNELTSTYSRLTTKAFGFTMAEILLSLTIIGVVAAITLPSLTGNINERTWNTQRKALFARMSQAIALMPALNGYGSTLDNHAETFITSGLSKVLKINNICDKDSIWDCGWSKNFIDGGGTKRSWTLPIEVKSLNYGIITHNSPVSVKNTTAAAFETANGESILTFYNPNCTAANVIFNGIDDGGNNGEYIKQHVCANFVFDLNGKKGPNTVGKDMGVITVVYSSDSKVVMPMYPRVLTGKDTQQNVAKICGGLDEGQYRLPNIEELLAIYYNRLLMDNSEWQGAWSSSTIDSEYAWIMGKTMGMKYKRSRAGQSGIVCVQR